MAPKLPRYAVLKELLSSRQEYCLALRTSSRTAGITVPYAPGESAKRRLFARDLWMEQVVALAARQALDLTTYAMVDPRKRLVPPGPAFLRTPDRQWDFVTASLIRRAHSIVLMLQAEPPGSDPRRLISADLARQVEQIVRLDYQYRVIVVLPPFDRLDPATQQSIHHRACVLLTLLNGGGHVVDGQLRDLDHHDVRERREKLPGTALVVKVKESGGEECWSARSGWETGPGAAGGRTGLRRQVVAAPTYIPGISAAINAIEREMYELSFLTRYQ